MAEAVDTKGISGTPWGISTIWPGRPGSASSTIRRAVDDITTTRAARSMMAPRMARWDGLGSRRMVWHVTTTGALAASMKRSTSCPSWPPKMPYSCWSDTSGRRRASTTSPASRSPMARRAGCGLRPRARRPVPDRPVHRHHVGRPGGLHQVGREAGQPAAARWEGTEQGVAGPRFQSGPRLLASAPASRRGSPCNPPARQAPA